MTDNEMTNRTPRSESDIFCELSFHCKTPGYGHVIAFLCFQNNTISYCNEVNEKDLLHQFELDHLIRAEISLLIALASKSETSWDSPIPRNFQDLVNKTLRLLHELHLSTVSSSMTIEKTLSKNRNQQSFDFTGAFFREAAFYSGESAYHFQYLDLSIKKYCKDSDWLRLNKGYALNEMAEVVSAIKSIQDEKLNTVFDTISESDPDQWDLIEIYKINAREIASKSKVELSVTQKVIESFADYAPDYELKKFDDFNQFNAYPIINLGNENYILFQYYSLTAAIYETPFFWFNSDKNYVTKASKHRGDFTEDFAFERLKLVFGERRVFKNIKILSNNNSVVGEFDVLVIFGNRAIVLQAKSKKLTINARQGNVQAIKTDFKLAVQEAYDQAYDCADLLNDSSYRLVDAKNVVLDIPRKFEEIYPVCVVSDHYPALFTQAKHFLNQKVSRHIMPAFVTDIFFLDVATEFLDSPLYFLSYINRRTAHDGKILSSHELVVLAYHLNRNLWISDEYSFVHIGDDFCASLDLAMMSRRNGMSGKKTPEGILTKYNESHIGRILKEIELIENPNVVAFGFMLLTLSEKAINNINQGVSELIRRGLSDGLPHNLTLGFKEGSLGLTIHCNDLPDEVALKNLSSHCERRKYTEHARQWFGICISPTSQQIRFGITKDFEWVESDSMNEQTKSMRKPQFQIEENGINFRTTYRKNEKIGRNQMCPCGSGKKFKHCCLN